MNVPAAKTVLLGNPERDTLVPLATVFSMPEKGEKCGDTNEEYKIVYTKEEKELMMEMEKLMMERISS